MSLSSIGFSRDLLQITMATFLLEVMDIESWGELRCRSPPNINFKQIVTKQ